MAHMGVEGKDEVYRGDSQGVMFIGQMEDVQERITALDLESERREARGDRRDKNKRSEMRHARMRNDSRV